MKFSKTFLSCSRAREGVAGGGLLPSRNAELPAQTTALRRRLQGRRWAPSIPRDLRCISLVMVLNFGVITGSALAQAATSGPVHLPPPGATNALTATPAAALSPAVAQAAPPSPALVPQSAASAGDIHDIRGPISIPYQWLWTIYLVSGLALAAVLYAGWRWFRQHRAAKAKLPFEIALERLDAIRALMTENQVREYAFAASEIIRVYIEQRFGEKAAHRTTDEFLFDLLQQTGTPLGAHRRRLEDFLSHCDLPKFARWQFSVHEMESMHESARTFILETRPQPVPAKPAKADALPQPELLPIK